MFNLSSIGQKDGSKLSGIYGNGYKGRWCRRSVFLTQYIFVFYPFSCISSHPLCLFRLISWAMLLTLSVFFDPFSPSVPRRCAVLWHVFVWHIVLALLLCPFVLACVFCVYVWFWCLLLCGLMFVDVPPVCLFVLSSGVFHVLVCLCILNMLSISLAVILILMKH